MRTSISIVLTFVFGLCAALPVLAVTIVPAGGSGTMTVVMKDIYADREFSSTVFGGATFPSTRRKEMRLQITGEHGIGKGWALQYDLRFAGLQRTKKARTTTATGFEDQQIGLIRELQTGPQFATALAMNVVLPTGSQSTLPRLGDGHFAFEPQYQLRMRTSASSFLGLSLGARFYASGLGTQLRATGEAGTRLSGAFDTKLSVFYAKMLDARPAVSLAESNVLRGGIWLRALRWGRVRPEIGYERDFAGEAHHAEQRISLGFSTYY